MDRWTRFVEDDLARARQLAAWRQAIEAGWSNVRILRVEADGEDEVTVGTSLEVRALIQLGDIRPEDVKVEVYSGVVGPNDALTRTRTTALQYAEAVKDEHAHRFTGRLQFRTSGQHGLGLRLMAQHPDIPNAFDTGLLLWA